MTKTEYHSILVHRLEQAKGDLPIWPPGIAPGTLRTGVTMDDLSHASLTSNDESPIVAELKSLSEVSESLNFELRHDEFMKSLTTKN